MRLPAPPRPSPRRGRATAWAVFLDVDGTLLELAPHPDAVVVGADLRALLELLDARLAGALALISGRTLSDVDRLFAPRRFAAAGLHGLQCRTEVAQPDPEPPGLTALAAELEARFAGRPGVLLERKGPALALHYRLAPEAEAEVRAAAAATLARLGLGYRLQHGHAVAELIPSQASKGAAIRRLMAGPPFAGRRPVFLGDDLTDESGFVAVNALGGLAIRVGASAPTAARYALPDTAAVHAWLRALAEADAITG